MSVYVISDVEILDEELAETYRAVAQSSIALYHGRYIVRGAEPEVLEGDVHEGRRLVVVEFPHAETARRWYGSSEYAPALALRADALSRRLLMVTGVGAAAHESDVSTNRQSSVEVPVMTPEAVAATYFEAWKAGDFATLRSILADDVTFDGPFAQLDNADDCVKGLRGMSQIMTDISVIKRFVDGPDVVTWFDLHSTSAPPVSTANWSRVENGRITSIRVVFDPRSLA